MRKRQKHISVGRIMDYMRCPFAYWESINRARERQATEEEVVGNASHKLTAGDSPTKTREFVAAKLPHLAEDKREAVMAEAVALSITAKQMSSPEVTQERREVQLMWFDPESGYEIYAKPDELFFFDEVVEHSGGRRKTVMQITDVKTQAEQVRSYHWRQVFLFGLIATMSLRYYHSIKLVVRLAGPEKEEHRWFSQRETPRQLERLRATLRQIDKSWQTRTFEEKPGSYCKNCPALANCGKGTQYMEAQQGRQQLHLLGEQPELRSVPVLPEPAAQACA